ncbi:multicopper oxidase family protein [Lysobacter antibioticus]|uniref:Multicopper oxidase family protein n=1 Tax=Lysobacter antibioticus TaxID=84531 RepID=A0A0S2FFT6_LYSAN|nr:multicopper oxidase family protein [Lysobacter antibioticus]ALN82394.1 multicopper oxidase family protein [Lysobacter antibioticus]
MDRNSQTSAVNAQRWPTPRARPLALACLLAAAPLTLCAQDDAPRELDQPVMARMLRSGDAKTPSLLLTKSGPQPLDTHEAILDLRITYTVSNIWNPQHNRFDKVKLRSYQSPGTDPSVPFVAPTIVTSPGETVRVRLDNALPPEQCGSSGINVPHCFNSTNLHSHGLWVSPTGNSDNVLLTLRPGVKFEYEYNLPADHPAGTFWYHPHLHGSTALQVSSGMAGALLVRGNRLPSAHRNGDLDTLLRDPGGTPYPERVLLFQQVAYACRGAPTPTDPLGKIKTDPATGAWVCNPDDVGGLEAYDQFGFTADGKNLWNVSGRYTSINGEVLPTFFGLVAGRAERWRLLHAGVRNTINLQLRAVRAGAASIEGLSGTALDGWVTQNCTGPLLPQFEVAADGLSHAQAIEKGENILQPGYRSDALVVFPQGGRYCVIDGAAPPGGSITNAAEDRQLLGLANVAAGSAPPVNDIRAYLTQNLITSAKYLMPEDIRAKVVADLSDRLRLNAFVPHKDITAGEVTGKQELVFDIDTKAVPLEYKVNGKSYDPNSARDLVLGNIEEWTLTSKVGAHPFHIHVNPFQVVSILNPQGVEVSVTGEPGDSQYANTQGTWKDTLFVKPNYKLFVRTRYERYIGEYVLHCHILDHEDQGMMQNVRMLVPDGKGGGIGNAHH